MNPKSIVRIALILFAISMLPTVAEARRCGPSRFAAAVPAIEAQLTEMRPEATEWKIRCVAQPATGLYLVEVGSTPRDLLPGTHLLVNIKARKVTVIGVLNRPRTAQWELVQE